MDTELDCPECGETDCIKKRYDTHYVAFWCDECLHQWEEDKTETVTYVYKNVGFAGAYSEQAKIRRAYEKHYGPIPRNWELHHIDHNPQNNDFTNLIAIPQTIHTLIHANSAAYGSKPAIRALLKNLK